MKPLSKKAEECLSWIFSEEAGAFTPQESMHQAIHKYGREVVQEMLFAMKTWND